MIMILFTCLQKQTDIIFSDKMEIKVMIIEVAIQSCIHKNKRKRYDYKFLTDRLMYNNL